MLYFPFGDHFLKKHAMPQKMFNDENSPNISSITILQYGFFSWFFLLILNPCCIFSSRVHYMKRRAMVKTPLIFHPSQFFHMGFACEFFLVILNPCFIFHSGNHCLKKHALRENTYNDKISLNISSITILQYGFFFWKFSNHIEPMLNFFLQGVSTWKDMQCWKIYEISMLRKKMILHYGQGMPTNSIQYNHVGRHRCAWHGLD